MSNGYLLAAEADIETARAIADGFGLDLISADTIGDHETTGAALAAAASVGLLLSTAASRDEAYVALLQSLVQRLQRAQLIIVEPEAREAFAFIPAEWPVMPLEEAQARASELARQRAAEPPQSAEEAPQAEQAPGPAEVEEELEGAPREEAAEAPATEAPEAAAPPAGEEPAAEAPSTLDSRHDDTGEAMQGAPAPAEPPAPATQEAPESANSAPPGVASQEPRPSAPPAEEELEIPSYLRREREAPMPPAPEPPTLIQPAPEAPPQSGGMMRDAGPRPVPAPAQAPAPQTRSAPAQSHSQTRAGAPASAPADATAFAPRKLRRETPELVRIVMHQPKDLQAVIKAARKIDPRAAPAPQGMSIGEVALGASIGVALDVRGGRCDGTLQRRTWRGEPIDFAFTVEADAGVKQAVFVARVFIDDAQIGVLAFTRPIKGPAKKPTGLGDRVRLKRHKRVFLSYSSRDREVVSAIATAYQMAGVQHFWDRASLKSGEEWSPRLRREIDRADLFHLCWSRAASDSEWVHKEAEHALTRRQRSNGKRPDITVQMLDGPPWAPHPATLDSINFDDFVRAAIVGYARGDGSN